MRCVKIARSGDWARRAYADFVTSAVSKLPLPCEDCGGRVVAGPEPVDHGVDRDVPTEQVTQLVEFCTNLACPSNNLGGLRRIGVNTYVCTSCATELAGPANRVWSHRRLHKE